MAKSNLKQRSYEAIRLLTLGFFSRFKNNSFHPKRRLFWIIKNKSIPTFFEIHIQEYINFSLFHSIMPPQAQAIW